MFTKLREIITLILLSMLTLTLVGCGTSTDEKKIELTVSAAISLTNALEEIEETYGKENNINFKFNLGSSGTLAQQIKQGAPVDVFISANEDWMDRLEESDGINIDSRKDITGNRIVLVGPKDEDVAVESIEEITPENGGQIAIGNPESVPAGKYTETLLSNLDKWDELEDNFIMAKDVRQVLTYVETGNAEIGFVYGSDAANSDSVEIIATADKNSHDPIIYPGAVITDSKQKEAALEFLDYLESDPGQEILEKYGFTK